MSDGASVRRPKWRPEPARPPSKSATEICGFIADENFWESASPLRLRRPSLIAVGCVTDSTWPSRRLQQLASTIAAARTVSVRRRRLFGVGRHRSSSISALTLKVMRYSSFYFAICGIDSNQIKQTILSFAQKLTRELANLVCRT